jgi:hypothetical protein
LDFLWRFYAFLNKGSSKTPKKNFLGKIHVKNVWPKKLRFCFFFLSSLPSAFVRFSTRGVQEHHKTLFWGNTCQKLLAEKVEETKLFSFRLFPSILVIAFLAVSLHEEPKNTVFFFPQIPPENLKKSQKR